jgi:hypothetical protein
MLLTKVSAEFRGFIETSIPQIIDLLKDNDEDVRSTSVEVLSKLSEQGM